ncbi:hypothetical protein [uncultured Corynebacterium sp.]|uniref:hypothetical protein n=1 Tax=uncultured Corynebacterium sp. TaxID=159447 RepID=UPI00261D3107|nr:hypothetical protein [uncultured Corynebacterium sp.]
MSSEFTINYGEMNAVLQHETTLLVRKAQRATLNQAKVTSPVDTGALRNSHTQGAITYSNGRATSDIEASADYSLAVHEGSRPHVIRPRRAKVLAWRGTNGMVFARSVNHPGAKKRPWLLNALKTGAGALGFEVTAGE